MSELAFLKDPQALYEGLKIYKELFLKYNKIHNISNYKDINPQLIDSLKILDFYDFKACKNIVDIGSGAGFPALFLAFVLKKSNIYLVEANKKKSAFLMLAKSRLKIENIKIIPKKIQDFELDFKVDLISSRALMKSKELIFLCDHIIDENTKMLLYKGSNVKAELEGLKYKIFSYNNRNYVLLENLKESKCSFSDTKI